MKYQFDPGMIPQDNVHTFIMYVRNSRAAALVLSKKTYGSLLDRTSSMKDHELHPRMISRDNAYTPNLYATRLRLNPPSQNIVSHRKNWILGKLMV